MLSFSHGFNDFAGNKAFQTICSLFFFSLSEEKEGNDYQTNRQIQRPNMHNQKIIKSSLLEKCHHN